MDKRKENTKRLVFKYRNKSWKKHGRFFSFDLKEFCRGLSMKNGKILFKELYDALNSHEEGKTFLSQNL